ncbi:leishmanolysin-related zinc metalloendopeptidase [Candidatus Palauibacter sp.]|uniref:leishmanolysin-related zinc metalloendopeptidase n=1 Tax=Candidatus Palauibacter sp. TaxID=3101350 RepID=UPI003CC53D44
MPVGTIPPQELPSGGSATVHVSGFFRDPDGDRLTYFVTTSKPNVVTAAVSGMIVTLTGVAKGTATITVTATDPGGLGAQQSFTANVPNQPPRAVGELPSLQLAAGDSVAIDVASYFEDPDGDVLTYAATTSDATVATTSVSDTLMTVEAVGEGAATVTVTATDPDGLSVDQEVSATVVAPELTIEDFISIAEANGFGGTARRGGPPTEGDGPSVSLAISSLDIINGGTVRSPVTADEQFTTLYVFVGGVERESSGSRSVVGPAVRQGDQVVTGANKAVDSRLLPRNRTVARGRPTSGDRVLVDGYYEVGLPAATNSANILLQFPQSMPSTEFDLILGAASGTGAVGSYASLPVTVVVVGTGDIQISLSWDSDADLDLHVVEPSGEEIYYGNSVSQTGGTLDLDSNSACGSTQPRNENTTWPSGRAPTGTYVVRVNHWSNCGAGLTNYVVRVTAGEHSEVHTGSFTGRGNWGGRGSGITMTTFSFGAGGNRGPLPVGAIPPDTIEVGASVTRSLSSYFSDPDGDQLTYAAATSNSSIGAVSISGSTLTVTGVGPGTATVTVTARDPGNLIARQAYHVTVTDQGAAAEALMALYNSTDGPNWTRSDNWGTDAPLGEWYGVTTDERGRVTRLDLRDNGLSGPITAELGRLTSLRYLHLSFNRVTAGNQADADLESRVTPVPDLRSGRHLGSPGPPPVDHRRLDEDPSTAPPRSFELAQMSELAATGDDLGTQGVRQAGLTGPIPPELGNLAELDTLGLTRNSLTGPIPPELGNLRNLRALWLGNNQLVDSIPPELGNLQELHSLALWQNRLTGSIPPELGRLGHLRALSLGGNPLTGSIPPELGRLGNLQDLLLWENQLTGSIPPELGSLGNLTSLNLTRNGLSGAIPRELGSLDRLTALALGGNSSISGAIPRELGDLTGLVELYLWGNDLSGSIPPELSNLANLTVLSLHTNRLSGPLPLTMANLDSLSTFWFQDTELCVPRDADFQAWLASLESVRTSGLTCGGPDGFRIDLVLASYLTAAQESVFRGAAERWMTVLAATELPDFEAQEWSCGDDSRFDGYAAIDDVMIVAVVEEIDGPGGTLASAGPCWTRRDGLPIYGRMSFDSADLRLSEQMGHLDKLVLHEMGHVLGIGTIWDDFELLRNPASVSEAPDTHFTGPLAIAAFDEAGGTRYDGAKVPVENTGGEGTWNGHWREAVMEAELMTGWAEEGGTEPLSAITIQSLADLGYAVDATVADHYRLPRADAARKIEKGRLIPYGNDIWRGPIIVADSAGRVVRVIRPR